MTWPVQELKAFLTVEGSLADSYQWRQLQPLQGSVLEGIARRMTCAIFYQAAARLWLSSARLQGVAALLSCCWSLSWHCRPAMLGRMHCRVPTMRWKYMQA